MRGLEHVIRPRYVIINTWLLLISCFFHFPDLQPFLRQRARERQQYSATAGQEHHEEVRGQRQAGRLPNLEARRDRTHKHQVLLQFAVDFEWLTCDAHHLTFK